MNRREENALYFNENLLNTSPSFPSFSLLLRLLPELPHHLLQVPGVHPKPSLACSKKTDYQCENTSINQPEQVHQPSPLIPGHVGTSPRV